MSSDNVWTNLVNCIQRVTKKVKIDNTKAIAFIATPGLVCLDKTGAPLTASVTRDPNLNIILPYDMRSTLETKKINKTHHQLLQYYGDTAQSFLKESKLMWLKSNLKEECWNKAGHFFDLTDFLTWKATGSLVRSSATLTTQWTYEMSVTGTEGWNGNFLNELGIGELTEDNFHKIGSVTQRPGTAVGEGLLTNMATEMGLQAKLPVAMGLPDALSGCLGVVGCEAKDVDCDLRKRLCIVFGTRAASHFVLSEEPRFIKGINGPFRDSILPNMWLNQAGQTTAESALEFIIDSHPATTEIKKQIGEMHIHKYLNKILKIKAQKSNLTARSYLTKFLHVLPDFEGNKSPLADPWIRGMISGLSIPTTQESLALLYLATMQSLAYSTKHIMSALTQNGHEITCILIGGHLGKNSLFTMLQKDVCQVPTISAEESRSQLLGAAILAGLASGHFRDFNHALKEMCGTGKVILPENDLELIEYHKKKYEVFLKMYDHQLEYRRIMNSGRKGVNKVHTKQ
ncbi:hypothetical protein ABEB36_002980 [Hypothenemus hampei]